MQVWAFALLERHYAGAGAGCFVSVLGPRITIASNLAISAFQRSGSGVAARTGAVDSGNDSVSNVGASGSVQFDSILVRRARTFIPKTLSAALGGLGDLLARRAMASSFTVHLQASKLLSFSMPLAALLVQSLLRLMHTKLLATN